MANKIGVFNISKGSAKTTTVAYLAAAFAASNKKVVSVDISSERNTLYNSEVKQISFSGLKWEHVSVKPDFIVEALNNITADYILVDVPNIEYNVILKSLDSVIIPIEAEFYGLENLSKILFEISKIEGLLLEGIILTKVNTNSEYSNVIRKELNDYFPNFIFDTEIKRSYYLANPTFKLDNLNDSGFNVGFIDYLKLANEIIENER